MKNTQHFRYARFAFLLIMGGFLISGIQGQPAAQQVTPANNSGQPQFNAANNRGNNPKAKYAPGRFIVKFKSEGAQAVNEDAQYLLESNGRFQDAVSDKSDSLDKLNKKHNVRKAKSVFIERHGLTTADAKQKQARLERVSKVMHQSRSQRADQNSASPDMSNVYVIDVPPESDIETIVQEYQADPHVEYAQPDYLMETYMVPNDPYYSSYGSWGQNYDDLWGLKKIQAGQSWDLTQGEGVVVAVVDTGLDYNHPDIAANVWTNPGEIPNNGIDDDGNGFVDDVRGWDFANSDDDPVDGNGHGTHVSGTIAAVGNNNLGIIGVAPKSKIMPLKALSDTGSGWTSDLANAIIYAAQNGADVINNSWGCSSPCPSNPIAENAVRTAYNLGAVVVFGAGNSGADVSGYSPANMTDSKPIVVSAITPDDTPAYFTNFGVLVDVAAPGQSILSLKAANTALGAVVGTDYMLLSGTSMAAPHVSGTAALVLANHPNFTNEQVRQVLRASADDVNSLGFDAQTGAGCVNAVKALTTSPLSNCGDGICQPDEGFMMCAIDCPSAISSDGFCSTLDGTKELSAAASTPVQSAYLLPSYTFMYTGGPFVRQANQPIEPIRLVYSGVTFAIDCDNSGCFYFSVTTNLPAGLSFDGMTGAITGTPTVESAPTTYTVTGFNTAGQMISTTLSIEVNPLTQSNEDVRIILTNRGTRALLGSVLFSGGGVLDTAFTGFSSQLGTDLSTYLEQDPAYISPKGNAQGFEFDSHSKSTSNGQITSGGVTLQLLSADAHADFRPSFLDGFEWKIGNKFSIGRSLSASDFYLKMRFLLTNNYDLPDIACEARNILAAIPRCSEKCIRWPGGQFCYPTNCVEGAKENCSPTHISDVTTFSSGVEGLVFDPTGMTVDAKLLTAQDIQNELNELDKLINSFPDPYYADLRSIWTARKTELLAQGTAPRLRISRPSSYSYNKTIGIETAIPIENIQGAGLTTTLLQYIYPVAVPLLFKTGPDTPNSPESFATQIVNGKLGKKIAEVLPPAIEKSLPPFRTQQPKMEPGLEKIIDPTKIPQMPVATVTMNELSTRTRIDTPSPEYFLRSAAKFDLSYQAAACAKDMTVSTSPHNLVFDETPNVSTASHFEAYVSTDVLERALISLVKSGLFCGTIHTLQGDATFKPLALSVQSIVPQNSKDIVLDASLSLQLDGTYNSLAIQQIVTVNWSTLIGKGPGSTIQFKSQISGANLAPRITNYADISLTDQQKMDIQNALGGTAAANDSSQYINSTLPAGDYGTPTQWTNTTPDEQRSLDTAKASFPIANNMKENLANRLAEHAADPDLETKLAAIIGPTKAKDMVNMVNNQVIPFVRETDLETEFRNQLALQNLNIDLINGVVSGEVSGSADIAQLQLTLLTPFIEVGGKIIAAPADTSDPILSTPRPAHFIGASFLFPPVNNHAPTLTSFSGNPIGPLTVNKGGFLGFVVNAVDSDNDPITYSVSDLPPGAVFTPSNRSFSWYPTYTQAGTYNVTFTVSDGFSSSGKTVAITVPNVNVNVNQAPILDAIGPKSVKEGQLLTFTVSASDPDGDPLTYYIVGSLPDGATFDASTHVFSWMPTHNQIYNYGMVFAVRDGTLGDSEAVSITVNANRIPVMDAIGPKSVKEGQLLTFTVSASDPDGDPLTYYASNLLPSGASFNPSTRVFSWTPDHTQVGNCYGMAFYASDNYQIGGGELVLITVNDVSVPPDTTPPTVPVLSDDGAYTTKNPSNLVVSWTASDPESGIISFQTRLLEGGTTTGTVIRDWTSDYFTSATPGSSRGEIGYVNLTLIPGKTYYFAAQVRNATGAWSNVGYSNGIIAVDISDTTPPTTPVVTDEGANTASASQLSASWTSSEPDSGINKYRYAILRGSTAYTSQTVLKGWTSTGTNASVTASGLNLINGQTYYFAVQAQNWAGQWSTQGYSDGIVVNTTPLNQPPVMNPIGNRSIDRCLHLGFRVSGSDPDGDPLTYTASGLPQGATFSGQDFAWDPGYVQGGTYNVTFTVSDGSLSASDTVTITVVNANCAPILNPIGNKSVTEGQFLTFTVSATDPDGDALSYTASDLPVGATFTGQTFSWTPSYTQAGSYFVIFRVSDGSSTDTIPNTSEWVHLTVFDNVPDLIVTSLSGTAASGITGTDFIITSTIKNQGGAVPASSVTPNIFIAFYLSSDATITNSDYQVYIHAAATQPFDAGAVNTATITVKIPTSKLPTGTYYLGAIVDSDSSVTESDETNNTLTGNTLAVTGYGPDLFLTSVSGPLTAVRGQRMTLKGAVKNQGVTGTTTTESFTTKFYLSTDNVITPATDIPLGIRRNWDPLPAGNSVAMQISPILPTTLAPGTYYIGAVTDTRAEIRESKEGNNKWVGNQVTVQ